MVIRHSDVVNDSRDIAIVVVSTLDIQSAASVSDCGVYGHWLPYRFGPNP